MLTAEQEVARKGKMTASRVACLMNGDAPKILQLYREMIGEAEPENLDDVWAVQLGSTTERLNLNWYERKNKRPLFRCGMVMTHPDHQWAAATLDGFDEELKCPVECKHVGGREPMEIIIDRYQPQMQWQMFVTGARECALSVIMGAHEPVVDYIPRADLYIDEMVARADRFMLAVAMRQPPVVLAPVPPPIDPKAVINMTGNNRWAAHAENWLVNKDASEKFEDAKKILKELVPSDAIRCFGHGVRVTRDRAGRLHIREDRI